MILACQNIEKSFDGVTILQDASFHIEEREKAALVGINGAGKSTLFRIIVGELSPDNGQVILAKGKTLGYLAQHQEMENELTIYDCLLQVKQHILDMEIRMREMEAEMKHTTGEALTKLMDSYSRLTHEFEMENGYAYKSELTGVLKGLGFQEEDFQKQVSMLSGGQKTRVALGRLLLSKPDIILLDEPTNHLDMDSIAWLETYLLNYPGAVFIVSHDRYFLDKVATKIVEIDNGKVSAFTGNYSAYSEKKALLRKAAYQAYLNQQQEIKHQEEVIAKLKSFNREKSIRRAESREKMLDKMEVLEKPVEIDSSMKITLKPRITSGNDVLTVEGLGKSFPPLTLFEDLNFSVKRGERVAIIGNNGTGKTTILKILNEIVPPDTGCFHLGSKVHIGYYDQEHHVLHNEKTIFEEISDDFPKLTNTEIRNLLAAFLFTGDDVFKPIQALSGGEKGRVSLAKLMLSHANFLILDEPTNHLDIQSKEILESAMNAYTGTILYVSHDRYFINKTATRILEISDHGLTSYPGNYQDYIAQKEKEKASLTSSTASSVSVDTESKLDWKQQKEEQAKQRKKENRLKKVEEQITELETKQEELSEAMSLPENASDPAKLMELSNEQASIASSLEELYEEWETLC